MVKIKNFLASRSRLHAPGFTLQASGFIFKLLACSFWLAAVCSILFSLAFRIPCFAQDKIVAIVNNDIITQKDLNDFLNFMRIQLSQEYSGAQLENKIQSIKLDLLDRLIEDRLILQEAKRDNLKIDENRVKLRISDIKKGYASDIEFQNALAKQGLVEADIESKIREQLLMYYIIDIKVKSKIIVNPAEVTDFYQKNSEEFRQPQQRELDSLTFDDENLANDIVNQLRNNVGLADLAKKYSLTINKLTVREGGQLRKDIEAVLFKMRPQEIAGPIKIENSYYVFKLNSIIATRQENLSETQDKIYAFLFDKKMQEGLAKWLDELKKRSYIKIIPD
jgi:parvulin-like peptidyl-prolyl isomerase